MRREPQSEDWTQAPTTKATLDKTLYIDYWRMNKTENQPLRDSLGLSPNNY